MVENKQKKEVKEERFEFVLTINDFIICQRYFWINGYNESSVLSTEFMDSFRKCVNLIKDDLATKSRIYTRYTSPQIFDTYDQLDKAVKSPSFKFASEDEYILVRESEEVYHWNGSEVTPYGGYFNKPEYLTKIAETAESKNKVNPEVWDKISAEGLAFLKGNDKFYNGEVEYPQKNVMKFAFLDNGREVCAECWDGNIYPKFVRNNIDLSSSKNKYKSTTNYAPYEAALIDLFNESQEDIIPVIIREICVSCSRPFKRMYNLKENYGDVTYNNAMGMDSTFVKEWEHACYQKTKSYFKGVGA